MKVGILAAAAMMGLSAAPPAHSVVTVYFGVDYSAYSITPRPQSTSASLAFDSAAQGVGQLSVIDFESSLLGSFTSLQLSPTVTVTGQPAPGYAQSAILNVPTSSQDARSGYNTTAGGSKFNQIFGGGETFTFSTPVVGFGAFITGIENNAGASIAFNNGTIQTLSFPQLYQSGIFGDAIFVGFVDSGASISSVTINIGRVLGLPEGASIDDVRYVSAVPELTTSQLLLGGLLLVLMVGRLRSKHH